MSSDRADRDARQDLSAGQHVAADDEPTLVLGPLLGLTDQGTAGTVPEPAEADMTVIFPPLGRAADGTPAGSVQEPAEADMTVVFQPLAWGAGTQIEVGTIPQQPPGFLPRPTLLAQLDQAEHGTSAVQVLTGIAGAGKTQLAAAYARAKLAAGWRLVAWINAEDTGSLLAGLAAVADAAGLSGRGSRRDAADLGRAVRRQLEADGERCLLVFDDVQDPDVVWPFVPVDGAARLLVTSTRQPVTALGISVPVDVFSEEEALAFLAERTGLGDGGAAAVVGLLGALPLTLAQAAGVLAGQWTRYGTYLKRARALSAGDYLTPEKDHQPYPRGVAESVLLSMRALRADDPAGVCTGILEIMAVLSPNGVRRELLYAAGRAGVLAKRRLRPRVSATVVVRALVRLAERSLLTFSLDGQTVIMHSLVMQVMRERLDRRGRLAAVCWAAASVLDTRAGMLAGSPDRMAAREIPEQVTALRKNAAGSGAGADHELARRLLSLQSWALYHLNELGDSVSQAIGVGEPLVADFEREFGADHPETLGLRNHLALAYLAAGRPAEAGRLFEQILARQERLQGVGHPDTLTTQNSLAAAYQAAGRPAEAVRLYELIFAARARQLGADHPDTLTTQNNLAAAYWDAGRADDAIVLFERTLAARERLLGAEHPRTLNSLGNLAAAYKAAGRDTEAISLFEQTLAGQERLLGPDHPNTQRLRGNLAAAYRSVGRVAEAIPLHEQILTTSERLLGADHPKTLKSQDDLAAAYRDAGRTVDAIRLFEQTLTARERLLGADHPDVLATRASLEAAWQEAGRPE